MADVTVLVTFKEDEYPDIKSGMLEIYPNTSADDGTPVSDDNWVLTRIPVILGELARDGLRRKAVRLVSESQSVQITPTVDATLPDGTVISG
jgi:hypothetical protein